LERVEVVGRRTRLEGEALVVEERSAPELYGAAGERRMSARVAGREARVREGAHLSMSEEAGRRAR